MESRKAGESTVYIMCTFIAMITKFFTLHIQHISYQWNTVGKDIANRNLIISIPNHLCCFGVWLIWSSISAKILEMHNADPNLYPFDDWVGNSIHQHQMRKLLLIMKPYCIYYPELQDYQVQLYVYQIPF